MTDFPIKPLFIFELANNHMGRVAHGIRVIRELAEAAKGFPHRVAVKLQYRDLDTFIHPDYASRSDIKYVKRFQETRLSEDEFRALRDAIREAGLVAVCTAFDERSVDRVVDHGYDVLKIGSCSMTDWPLLERVVKQDLPIVFSTGGAAVEDIDRVVAFFTHREKRVALMHCVAEYPTRDDKLQLGQIDFLRRRYPSVTIGYSTHERPDNLEAVQIAIAKGAVVFEKHVGIATPDLPLNDYSATPAQVHAWLKAAERALQMIGLTADRPPPTETEARTLRSLQRGVFAKRAIAKGEHLDASNTFLAIPVVDDQITAAGLSKYTHWYATEDIPAGGPAFQSRLRQVDTRAHVHRIAEQVRGILRESKVVVPGRLELEISHHYGIEKYDEFGAAMVTLVNRGYCKKLIVMGPGQRHPEQFHKVKEESFHILWGDLKVTLDGQTRTCGAGDLVLVEPGTRHAFVSDKGCVIEELSSTHHGADSFYTDEAVTANKDRKTYVTYWLD